MSAAVNALSCASLAAEIHQSHWPSCVHSMTHTPPPSNRYCREPGHPAVDTTGDSSSSSRASEASSSSGAWARSSGSPLRHCWSQRRAAMKSATDAAYLTVRFPLTFSARQTGASRMAQCARAGQMRRIRPRYRWPEVTSPRRGSGR
jgi:hypothetical protein